MIATPPGGGMGPVIGELPNELARLFGRPDDITRIITDAGLDPRRLVFYALPPAIAWTWILIEAEHTPGVPAVVRAAQRDFPDNEVLSRALQDHQVEHLPMSRPGPRIRVEIIAAELAIAAGRAVFRYIPPGTALVGSDDGYAHERPRHRVGESAFFLQDAPVTRAEFGAFCDATGFRTSPEVGSEALCLIEGAWRPRPGATWRRPDGGVATGQTGDDHPVVQVSWYDASIYCRWLAEVTGLPVELPTESQWEYGAGGPAGLRWPFGDTYEPGMANLEGSWTTPVRQFPPTAFGLHDMAGNVYEWCADWFVPDWTGAGHALAGTPSLDPRGPGSGSDKVLRGGSWFDSPHHCRSANRFAAAPVLAAANWGFRCCLRLTEELARTLISEPGWSVRAEEMLGGVRP
jgi:formylglycine-generating enzyme